MVLENVGRRTYATLAILPFVGLGVADILLLVFFGTDPLWGFLILPPILFMTAIGWLAFNSGFVGREAEEERRR